MSEVSYEQFKLAIYCTAGCLNGGFEQLEQELEFFRKHFKLSKVYIESHRGDVSLSRERLMELKKFYEDRGIATAGGITPTLGDAYRPGYNRLFGGICYTEEASRAKFQEAVETAAAVFDEVIFDDFFFTNCACEDCLARKGYRSWEEFRLELMAEVSENLIMKPARSVNPASRMVIKYPNWNEAYQDSGYNTEKQPRIFDALYTGTETRDPAISQQHIPRYASYSLFRWMDNLAPGRNNGAWFDNLDCTYIDYYLEQANLSVFSGAKELTLFCYSLLKDSVHVPALGFQLDKLDQAAASLGRPVGAYVYEPHHAKGEDHLYDYLGMLAIPFELTPAWPTDTAHPLLITANAARDKDIIERMRSYLRAGGQIVMTSGFLERMNDRGVGEFTTLHPTGKKLSVRRFAIDTHSCTFDRFCDASEELSFPILDYSTNGSWQSIVALKGHNNVPILMYDNYGRGRIHTLVVPDDYADLWKMPEEVVSKLRSVLAGDSRPYRLSGPGQAGWFSYDNDAFVLENFAPIPQHWEIAVPPGAKLVRISGREKPRELGIDSDGFSRYEIRLAPSSLIVCRIDSY